MYPREFVYQIASEMDGDYPLAFKLLGFVVFLTEEGIDELLSGDLISPRTYERWMNVIDRAGWGDLLADARLRKELQDYLWKRYAGLPITRTRKETLSNVRNFLDEVKALPLQAQSRQASEAVKGERSETEGREAQTSALDGGADGGSLSGEGAPIE